MLDESVTLFLPFARVCINNVNLVSYLIILR